MSREQEPTAALLLIGDELLAGEVRDENGYLLMSLLRERGIRLMEINVVGDEPTAIAAACLRLCARADVVFTSGGLGPTHDDCTLWSLAKALDRPLVRSAEMLEELEALEETLTEPAKVMADLPAGTQLLVRPGWPVMRLIWEGAKPTPIYIFPGVPRLFASRARALFALPDELPRGERRFAASVRVQASENLFAEELRSIASEFSQLSIGSYPKWHRGSQGELMPEVTVVFRGHTHQEAAILAARHRFVRELGAQGLTASLVDEP